MEKMSPQYQSFSQPVSQPQSHPASYRDPSGFIFTYNNEIYRQVNQSFQQDFEHFISSGLYQLLAEEGLLISHEIVQQNFTGEPSWFTTLKPEPMFYQ